MPYGSGLISSHSQRRPLGRLHPWTTRKWRAPSLPRKLMTGCRGQTTCCRWALQRCPRWSWARTCSHYWNAHKECCCERHVVQITASSQNDWGHRTRQKLPQAMSAYISSCWLHGKERKRIEHSRWGQVHVSWNHSQLAQLSHKTNSGPTPPSKRHHLVYMALHRTSSHAWSNETMF